MAGENPAGGLSLVDDEYILRMTAFESDCNEGKGEPIACHRVGEFFSVVKDDHARSAKIYKDNCSRYPASCFNLGKLHLAGKGVAQDDTQALRLFEMACKGEHLSGCYHQGVLLFLSAKAIESVKKDQAICLLEKACEKGEVESCYFAASHLVDKETKNRNPRKAEEYFKRACASNHAPSCFNLAVLYNKGDGVVAKDEELFKQYKGKTNDLVARYGGLKGRKTS